ncbi:unnamed protein product [Parnassius apollo]|uniref:(apollo) hypothetical protein n=1 Tax=Parnassius apollo TaxID=110799 RepID=A0A8S3XMP2_PARAO|nr:unnamed protein product [Parnassius apollo]
MIVNDVENITYYIILKSEVEVIMEPLSNKIKRKKRKTRKSLNDLRKRLHGKPEDKISNNLSDSANNLQNEAKKNCIASSRLTLNLFHKAVRSETITRPDLSIMKKQTIFNKNKKTVYKTSITRQMGTASIDNQKCSSNMPANSSKNNVMEVLSDNSASSKENSMNYKRNLLDSPVMFSPVEMRITTTSLEKSESPITLATSSIGSPQVSDDQQLYEEFINYIPRYFVEKTPSLIREDIMMKKKLFLQNLYLEGCRRETEQNIFHCMTNNLHRGRDENTNTDEYFSPKKIIEEDPMNYIRQGYAMQQHGSCKSITSVSSSSPNSPLPILNTHNKSNSFIHDTPEYVYFPHKLNQ